MISLGEIVKAKHRIQGHIHNTPLMRSETLSEECGADVFVKLETLQKTGAFKARGIYNRILSSNDEERKRGFVTVSSGNHGLGLAYVSRELGIVPPVVVVPEYTPSVKVQAIRRQGAEVILEGRNWNEIYGRACALSRETGRILIHPFEDEAVIHGQGTIALEVLDQLGKVDHFVASIGGGSMIGANALAFKELSPQTRVTGLQTFGAAAMSRSVQAGRLVELEKITSRVESFATTKVSARTFELAQKFVDEIVLLEDQPCIDATLFMLERTHVLLELSASICVAALLGRSFAYRPGQTIVMVLCGGNVDLSVLASEIQKQDRKF